ncbi:MAG: methylase [Bacteroidales bacterium]|nr:methylase [Bacteroidales bacterium]
MAWLKVVGGRLKSDFRYSGNVVYNNFPWPNVSEKERDAIEMTAKQILEARNLYSESSLAILYDNNTMPIELRRAHRANDAAVLEAYGFPKDASESEIVARLFKMYRELTLHCPTN